MIAAAAAAAAAAAVPVVRLTQGVRAGEAVDMPAVGLGTFGYGGATCDTEPKGECWNDTMVVPLVKEWIALGGRRVDGAFSYYDQKGMGQGIREAIDAGMVTREELFIVSKTDMRFPNTPPEAPLPARLVNDTGYQLTLWMYDKILESTGLSYVDLLLIHWPGDTGHANDPAASPLKCAEGHPQAKGAKGYSLCRKEAWRALVSLLADGKVRAIGVSNHEEVHLKDIAAQNTVQPALNQIEFHPYFHEDALVAACAAQGIKVQSYSPLGAPDHMAWPNVSTWARMPADLAPVKAAAAAHGISPSQAILRWAWQAHGVSNNPRTLSSAHMKENLAALDGEKLTDAELAAIGAVAGGAGAPSSTCGWHGNAIMCQNKVCPNPTRIA